ncbi:MAG: hypothetical protein JNK53_04175 [Phycisphaerae bacterium]|nr:hypothetical protein [Phycisphaerae bacterium]
MCNKIRSYSTLLALAMTSLVQAETWNATADFNGNFGNPSGAWSYGGLVAGLTEFVPHTVQLPGPISPGWIGEPGPGGQPQMWMNLTAGVYYGIPSGSLSIHPGSGNQSSSIRWTAPAGAQGQHRVVGAFGSGDLGTPTVTVRHNGAQIWSAVDFGSFDLTLSIAPGDTLDFEAHGIYYYGNTEIGVTITSESPCPADLNGDGVVAGADLGVLLSNWGPATPSTPGNLDGNGTVDGADLGALLASWGSCGG